jgi:hypothetical protein
LAGEALAGEALAGEALVGTGATLGSVAAGVGLVLTALAGFGAGYWAWQEWETSEQAQAGARDLIRQARQGTHWDWQNGNISDEAYFFYLETGSLVIPVNRSARKGATADAGVTRRLERKTATDERWYYILILGNAYNRARMFDYPFNEIIVEHPDGRRYRLDATDNKEIVSRKLTQFAAVEVETGIRYVQEMVYKYHPGIPIAEVDSSEGILKTTKVLQGRMILSVPVQRYPIPRAVLKEAKRLGVTIRDDFGNEFSLEQPQPISRNAPVPPKSKITWPNTPPAPGSPGAGSPGYIELTED